MKYVLIFMLALSLLLSACTKNSTQEQNQNAIDEVNESDAQVVDSERTLTHLEISNQQDPLLFLQKAYATASKLEFIKFSSSLSTEEYLLYPDEPEFDHFYEYEDFFEGNLQRYNKLAYIYQTKNYKDGTIVDGIKDEYDPSTQYAAKTENYLVSNLGWYRVILDSFYGTIAEDLEGNHIFHYELDSSFHTLEALDKLIELFMQYPEQLSLEDSNNSKNGSSIITIHLDITAEQFLEHFSLLNYNIFTGYFNDDDIDYVMGHTNIENLNDISLELTFDEDYNILEIYFLSNYSGSMAGDTVTNTKTSNKLHIFFSDHNIPFEYTIPEDILLKAIKQF